MAKSKKDQAEPAKALETAMIDTSELASDRGGSDRGASDRATVRFDASTLAEIRSEEAAAHPSVGSAAAPHDGRFGKGFDDEIASRAIAYILLGLAVLSIAAFVLMGWMEGVLLDDASRRPTTASSFADIEPERVPPGPILQIGPEAELTALREEMRELTESYGWVDESAGLAHIPIETAMDLVLQSGIGAPGSPIADDSAPAEAAAE